MGAARATSVEAKKPAKTQVIPPRPQSSRGAPRPQIASVQQRPATAHAVGRSADTTTQNVATNARRRRSVGEHDREAKTRPSAAEQRRICERLSRGKRRDGADELDNTRLMRQLNESASWLSNISEVRSDDNEALASSDEEKLNHKFQQCIDGKNVCLADVLNESATWIDCDVICDSESDQGGCAEHAADVDSRPPAPPIEPVGWRQGVARSF